MSELLITGTVNPSFKNCAIIMPAYNEEEALPSVIEEWHDAAVACSGTLIIINDASEDRTMQVLTEVVQKYDHLVVLNKEHSGHGQTCVRGYRWAVDQEFQWVFQTDSDGQTCAEDFLESWNTKNDSCFILGNRISRKDSPIRSLGTKYLRYMLRLIFGIDVPDANVPFRLMRARELRPFLDQVPPDMDLANAYLAVLLEQSSFDVRWEPITFKPRVQGKPSASFMRLVKIWIRAIRDFRTAQKKARRVTV